MSQLLRPIEDVLTALLEWLHSSIGLPWAWAIISLTILVRIAILPLAMKQVRSAQRLAMHAPELKAIQQKYKADRQRMNEEVMKFYKENNVNPAAACLPVLLQVPVFFALYFVLRDFENEVFPNYPNSDLGWLGIFPSITSMPTAHWSGYLLMTIYVLSMLASTYFTFASGTMDPRQQNLKYVFYACPFLASPLFIVRFPVGLLLYWVTTNLWTIGQGFVQRRLMPRPVPVPKRTSRTPPKQEARAETAATVGADSSNAPAKPTGQQRVRRRKKKGPRARR
jgi:YidC/Oxa1 family membrane protein insertase